MTVVTIVGVERMQGTSKKTGKDYTITELDALDAMEIADLLTKAARQVMELSSIAECEGKR